MNRHNPPPGWRLGILADLIESIKAGVSVQCDERPAREYEIGVLKTGAVLNGRLDPSAQKFVPESQHPRLMAPLRKDTLIFCRKNSEEAIGACALSTTDNSRLFLSDLLWQIEPKKSVSLSWFFQLIRSPEVRQEIRLRATGTQSSMKNISRDRFLSVPALIPLPSEQLRIANILSTWEQAIGQSQILKARMEDIYEGAAQRYLNQRGLPFYSLEQLLMSEEAKAVEPTADFPALGVRSHGKGTFRRIEALAALDSGKVVYRVRPNRFIVNIVFAWEGAAAITSESDEGCLVSHRFPMFTVNSEILNLEYFRHIIRTQSFRQLLALASPGGAGRNKTLNRSDLLRFQIGLPTLARQVKIAAMLNDLDRQINALADYIAAATKQRNALATELLTGRLRVPLAATAGS